MILFMDERVSFKVVWSFARVTSYNIGLTTTHPSLFLSNILGVIDRM